MALHIDSLFCHEEEVEEEQPIISHAAGGHPFLPFLHTHPLPDHLLFLLRKEKSLLHNNPPHATQQPLLHHPRAEPVQWVLTTSALLNLSLITTVSAVSYLDRFLLTFSSWDDTKPWTLRLAAVACLSLASKMEEPTFHNLMDFQVGELVFQARTVERMELLVLSALKWEMNQPTPLSFLRYLLAAHRSRLYKCEALLLSLLLECSICAYRPSLWAASLIIHGLDSSGGLQRQLMAALGVTEEEVKGCRRVIAESCGGSSPRGVTDASFSCDSREEGEEGEEGEEDGMCQKKLKRRRMGEGEGDEQEQQHNSITCHCF